MADIPEIPPLNVSAMKEEPVILIIGARKTGKTQLAEFLVRDMGNPNIQVIEDYQCFLFDSKKKNYISILQYPGGLTRMMESVDYVFFMHDNNYDSRQIIYDDFGGIFPNLITFDTIFDRVTEDYGALVLDVKHGKAFSYNPTFKK